MPRRQTPLALPDTLLRQLIWLTTAWALRRMHSRRQPRPGSIQNGSGNGKMSSFQPLSEIWCFPAVYFDGRTPENSH